MGKLIYVLHERSTKEHFIALENYALKNDVKIIYREFLILRYLLKSIWKLDVQLFIQQVKNISFFISMFLCKNKNIIIGIAPLDTNTEFFFKKT